MIQTPTEENPHVICDVCTKKHDMASWQLLRLAPAMGGVRGTTIDGKEVGTHVVQSRLCTCGASVSVEFPLPPGTTPGQADALFALSVLSAHGH
jgi:hypothetical protein